MHLFPVSDPAGKSADGKQNGEHLDWDAHRPIDHSGIKIDVRIKFSLNEVIVFQCDFFQSLGNLKHRIVQVEFFEQVVAGFLDQLGSRVELVVPSTDLAAGPPPAARTPTSTR